jgi:hypothetical protein
MDEKSICADNIFENHKGRAGKRFEKRQRKLLAKILPHVPSFLEPNEKIQLVTTSMSPISWLEQLTTGTVLF